MSEAEARPRSSASANGRKHRKRHPRRGSAVQSGSPEVISSLISSLSAISSPADDFYNSLPFESHNKDSSPSPVKSRGKSIREDVISENPGQEEAETEEDLYSDGVASPRRSKLGSRTSSSRGHKRSTFRPPSSYSSAGLQRTKSIGNISVEPQNVASISSLNSLTGSRGSRANSVRSLNFKQSKEHMRSLERRSKSKLQETGQLVSALNMQASAEQMNEEDIALDKRSSKAKSMYATSTVSVPDSPRSLVSKGIPVPTRDSSKRHSYHTSRHRRSKNNSMQEQPVTEASEDEKFENVIQNSTALEQGFEDEQDEGKKSLSSQRRKTLLLAVSTNPSTGILRSQTLTSARSFEKENQDPILRSRSSFSRSFTEPLPAEYSLKKPAKPPSTIADSIDEAVEDYLDNPKLSQKVRDPVTGRMIAFSEVGDPTGSVVFCCVGMGTTRFLTAFYDELATTLKLRLITPDRPGIGDSEPYVDGLGTPLGWPDDIRAICVQLSINRFSVLAHSAGAVYALATALRMPQHIRGRIHLLAPWIPPSQMVAVGIQKDHVPITTLPYSQRLLRSLPASFFKIANSGIFAMTSSSVASAVPSKTKRNKRRSTGDLDTAKGNLNLRSRRASQQFFTNPTDIAEDMKLDNMDMISPGHQESTFTRDKERVSDYDNRLVHAIWDAAMANANPAVDLLVCLERRQEIGFRYADINKEVVIHHGSKDSRVPVENVKWLGGRMRRCEVRVLEGEGHGLMASAKVMSDVLGEMAQEWENWNTIETRQPNFNPEAKQQKKWFEIPFSLRGSKFADNDYASERLYTFSPETTAELRKFRLGTSRAKDPQAVIYSIDKSTLAIAKADDEVYTDISQLVDELPPNQPRYILLSYPMTMSSGRLSVPYVMIYYMPLNCSNEIRMLYAGARELLRSTSEAGKVIEISDAEELEEIEKLLGGTDD